MYHGLHYYYSTPFVKESSQKYYSAVLELKCCPLIICNMVL